MRRPLVLGPVLRHVDTDSAAVWVQTGAPATVVVRASDDPTGVWRAPTFDVHGHHYALVEVSGLAPGSVTPYEVLVGDEVAWPPPDSPFPPSVIRTLTDEGPVRLAFGSCRTSVPHDAVHHLSHGVDALRAYALALADGEPGPLGEEPDLPLLLGDQVYADSTSAAMQQFIRARRDLDDEPGRELKDYDEYAHLYELAWGDPALRWLLSRLPSLMIFDDHDVRDDWNTSLDWRRQMEATSWWHERIVAGLGSYWVYQHLGNLSVDERARDELWLELRRRQREAGEAPGVPLGDAVDAFAARVDRRPQTYRWSYARRLGPARLVVVDSRAARELAPDRRAMLDDAEMAWLDEQLRGDCSHLLVATSLPYLLPMGLHHLEAWNEAMAQGGWGRGFARIGEWLRQAMDLEHWGAFTGAFARMAGMVQEVASGRRGQPPASVVFLSGDVHHSYVAEVRDLPGSRVLQLVCSPIRNPLPRPVRMLTGLLAHGPAAPVGGVVARSAKVPDAPLRWRTVAGPWFDNNLALMALDDQELRVAWVGGRVLGADHDRPDLKLVADLELDVSAAGAERRKAVAHVHPRKGGGLRYRLAQARDRVGAS